MGSYRFEARVVGRPVSYGLDPASLYKRGGRIARLALYREVAPGTFVKVALYDMGWRYGRIRHLDVLRRVVTLLEEQAP